MRELLEYLGLVAPEPGRREPVALPAWARWTVPIAAAVLTLGSILIFAVVRVLLG
jgi:hypothetical protein